MSLSRPLLILLIFLALPFGVASGSEKTRGQPGNDTISLDEVSVSVLPFQQTYQESAGAVFTLSPQKVGLQNLVTTTELFNLVP